MLSHFPRLSTKALAWRVALLQQNAKQYLQNASPSASATTQREQCCVSRVFYARKKVCITCIGCLKRWDWNCPNTCIRSRSEEISSADPHRCKGGSLNAQNRWHEHLRGWSWIGRPPSTDKRPRTMWRSRQELRGCAATPLTPPLQT